MLYNLTKIAIRICKNYHFSVLSKCTLPNKHIVMCSRKIILTLKKRLKVKRSHVKIPQKTRLKIHSQKVAQVNKGRTGQERIAKDRTRQDWTGKERTGQERIEQVRTGQHRPGLDLNGLDWTGLDWTFNTGNFNENGDNSNDDNTSDPNKAFSNTKSIKPYNSFS